MIATGFEGKATFVTHADVKDFLFGISDQCTIALVSDWGADNDPAIHVRDQIVARHPDYVVHLGDIYYAGQDNEARSFLNHWPSAGQKRFSHHQPFSAFQPEHDNASRLRDDITRIYEAVGPDPIFGWFFGHEHKCTIYDDSYSSYRARLIGHGCIPHLPPGKPNNPPVPFTATNTTTRPDGSGYAISGFALLTLNGPILQVDYINEDGTIWKQETWTRTL